MTAGRKPNVPVVHEDLVLDEARRDNATAEMRAQELTVRALLDFEEPLRQVGQLEALEFTRRVADVAIAQIFENLRNSGKYKGLPYRDADGNTRRVASLEEFCEVKLGKSYRRCLDLSQNLRSLGPELYEQSERLGLRNVDYKALRALPAEDQALIRKAVEEAQTRDEVLDVLQEMAAKHVRENEETQKRVAILEDGLQGARDLAEIRGKENDKLVLELGKLQRAKPDEALKKLQGGVVGIYNDIRARVLGELRQGAVKLAEHHDLFGGDSAVFLGGIVGQIESELLKLRAEFALPVVASDEHGWVDEA